MNFVDPKAALRSIVEGRIPEGLSNTGVPRWSVRTHRRGASAPNNMVGRTAPSILPTINLRNLLHNNDFFLSGRTEFPHMAV